LELDKVNREYTTDLNSNVLSLTKEINENLHCLSYRDTVLNQNKESTKFDKINVTNNKNTYPLKKFEYPENMNEFRLTKMHIRSPVREKIFIKSQDKPFVPSFNQIKVWNTPQYPKKHPISFPEEKLPNMFSLGLSEYNILYHNNFNTIKSHFKEDQIHKKVSDNSGIVINNLDTSKINSSLNFKN